MPEPSNARPRAPRADDARVLRGRRRAAPAVALAAALVVVVPVASWSQATGRDPAFSQPSTAPGVDYTIPTEAQVKATLDRIREYFERTTAYRIIDTETGEPVSDFSTVRKSVGVDTRFNEYNDWTYSTGVVLAGMLHVAEATGDVRYREYTLRNFRFIFDHLEYFRRQAQTFGAQRHGYGRLLDMRELDDCGAIGAALVKTLPYQDDPRFRPTIDAVADFVSTKMSRMPDGTLARHRPRDVSIWADDFYMSVPLLAQMGALTGNRQYFDDAARQVVQMSARLFDPRLQLFDHSWFGDVDPDPHFFWGRASGWALMAIAELLTVMPADHKDRAAVMDVYRKAVQGVTAVQGGTGLWHQLLDRPDSYLESSATAMFTFAIARGVNRGWLPPVYAPVAQTGWQALAQRVRPDGQIEGICVSTTAAYDAVYYYNRPTELGATQGYGPTLMAGAEIITMLRGFDAQRQNNTFHYRPRPR